MRGWRGLDRMERVTASTKGSLYGLYALYAGTTALAAVGGCAASGAVWLPCAAAVLAIAQGVLAVAVVRRALGPGLGPGAGARASRWQAVGLTLVSLALTAVLGALWATGEFTGGGLMITLLCFCAAGFAGPLSQSLGRWSALGLCVVATAAATAATVCAGAATAYVWSTAWSALFQTTASAVGTRCSDWVLDVMRELTAARETEARLAVAEERLRFGRDLHDVLGRNLAVIALKGELAVQLARRGRPEAVEQMVEVQRLAQESQREVREVVRGYRAADLAAELDGALAVLRSAGVRACVESDDVGALSAGAQSALAWVVREGTTNVLRHGDPTRCAIWLRVPPGGTAVLTMENDGVPEGGTAVDAATRGNGLAGLRERLASLDGTLEARVEARAFTLTARLPVAEGIAGGAE
ncbi:histidine kinase [Streptantibioticus parmotrematis]|uniref:sensor histidine kinase n=1 Tax=Streptantibioticus parmotrematis TaxID=2873249 RepID=UPI0033C28273